MPPRLSLRFSALGDILAPNFLDLSSGTNGVAPDPSLPTFQYTPPAEVSGDKTGAGIAAPSNPFEDPAEVVQDKHEPDEGTATDSDSQDADTLTIKSSTTVIRDADGAAHSASHNDPMPVPRRITVDTTKGDSLSTEVEDTPTESLSPQKESSDDEPLYILQPKIYTPQASPLSSPRATEGGFSDSLQDLLSQPRSRGDASSPRLYIPPVEERLSYRSPTSPMSGGSYSARISTARQSSSVVSPSDSVSSERTIDSGFNNSIPKKKTSIRERVSLRTTPPDAILVPPPNAPQLQRPSFVSPRTHQNYRTFTGPDSAYSSDIDRNTIGASTEAPPAHVSSNGHDYSPPAIPNIIPSPHSDQQFFRPVQASPHSPLQQRPHTAGQVPSRPYHLRNAPSSMGMSMLSSVTTMTQDSKGQPRLKKKRSAFGWLKKAFTLDEDERVTFDQRRQVQERNLYYDNRSPKFLDGKRIK